MTAFAQTQAAKVQDREYFDLMLANVETASRRIWVSMFIYDILPARDVESKVLDLTSALIARWGLGVDVRVLMTGSVGTPGIAVANLASGLYLGAAGVPHRRVFGSGGARFGSHAKFAVTDDMALLGSQNWTDEGFSRNTEDAVMLRGGAAELLAEEFLGLWEIAKGMPRRATR